MKDFFNKFILLNTKDYGFEVSFYLNLVIILAFLALSVSCFIINKNQSSIALVLRKLIRAEAFGEENAKTLKELGLLGSEDVKKLLFRTSGYMKGIVTYVGAKSLTYDDFLAYERSKKKKKYAKRSDENTDAKKTSKIDFSSEFSSARFFIPSDKKEFAERAFAKNNGTLTKTVLSCVALIGFMLILVLLMPSVMKLLASII